IPAGQRPRVMAFVSRSNHSLNVSPRPDLSPDTDIQVLDVSTPAIAPFMLVNIYNERRGHQQQYSLERSQRKLNIPTRCVIAGDFNAYHTHWNPLTQQHKGQEPVLELIQIHQLHFLNEPG